MPPTWLPCPIEARICAENPAQGFLPATGTLRTLRTPEATRFTPGAVRLDSGVAAGRRRVKRVPDDLDARLHMAMLYARLGRADEARAEVDHSLELAPRDGFASYHAACVFCLLADPDDLDRALELLFNARDRGYYLRGELTRNTDLDVLRSLPSFGELED